MSFRPVADDSASYREPVFPRQSGIVRHIIQISETAEHSEDRLMAGVHIAVAAQFVQVRAEIKLRIIERVRGSAPRDSATLASESTGKLINAQPHAAGSELRISRSAT